MTQVRCPNCFKRFRPTHAVTAARQLEEHLNPGPFQPMRCIELRRQAGKVIRDAALQDPFFRKLVETTEEADR